MSIRTKSDLSMGFAILAELRARLNESLAAEQASQPQQDEQTGVSMSALCVTERPEPVEDAADFERLRAGIAEYEREMAKLTQSCADSPSVIKRLSYYHRTAESFTDKLKEVMEGGNTEALAACIKANFSRIVTVSDGYIRAMEGLAEYAQVFRKALKLMNTMLGTAGVYSEGTNGGEPDYMRYRVSETVETEDERLHGIICRYNALSYSASDGTLLAQGDVAVYLSAAAQD